MDNKHRTFNRLMLPEEWKPYFSKYPNGYSMLESIISWVSQNNDMIENINDWNKELDKFIKQFDIELQDTVRKMLEVWKNSGFLDETIIQAIADIRQTKNETVTVGVDGDYRTLNEALNYFSKRYPVYTDKGLECKILLKSDFIMQEQVFSRGANLGWIEIISEDKIVLVSRDSMLEELQDGRRPAFGAIDNGVLPILGTVFTMSAGSLDKVDGLAVFSNSTAFMRPEAGFDGFFRNIGAYSAKIKQYRPYLSNEQYTGARMILTNAIEYGVYATFQAEIGVPYSDISGSKYHGVLAIWGSNVDIYKSLVDHTKNFAVYGRDGSTINARECDFSYSDIGVYALHGSKINARYKDGNGASFCRVGVLAQHDSTVDAQDLKATDCLEFGLRASNTGTIEARGANVSRGKIYGAQSEIGSIINAMEIIAEDCEVSLEAHDGSTIAANGAKLNRAKRNSAYARKGATINLHDAEGIDCAGVGLLARGASTINAENYNGQGAKTIGANSAGLSRINGKGGKFRRNPAQDSNADLVVYDGGNICITGATGGGNIPMNSVTGDGIIFK